ncbi:UDP-N-acetylmuramoyl-tripeptide--D-alanyl-D-alanine ligase [Dyadobacter jejuensis]|uniref:UDP-N-acetylmuramoyl-tripeptide--D-alanyl-D-alanine ligase n=1 Tax=Dyadobacter jejuensis TaxID=1082580 RepID=A0A316BAN9_9BACT|nr:UDP-N-acetylmuramoyl-tripeptide--D-alanyl-D-alanine ligase [Dyadobacter jejuensis]PWJ59607.1 UDP-N-acetylmuramoyl-tripeptide--D-alanyl-D-alanine ligase [Dyadobacter jejuensis]
MYTTTEALYDTYIQHPQVFTDTRKIQVNGLFFALKGVSFDGNQYAHKALEDGAAYAIVDDPSIVQDERYLLVEDVLTALQDLARHHRKTFNFPVLALTGSNGKTTTKELLHKVLSMKYNTYATEGNLNNHIGVPLTLLAIQNKKHELAVIEMGANHQGEIAMLSNIAMPTHGLITNIGKAHLEGFGGIQGIKKGKGELLDYLSKKKGTIFVNSKHEDTMEMVSKRRAFGEIVFFGSETSPSHPELLRSSPVVAYKSNNGKMIETHLPGTYNFDNISAALAVAKYFEVTDEDANEAVGQYQPDNNRSQIVHKGSNTIIMDAYNANPSSMQAALQNFENLEAPRKIVILGDMYELGPDSDAEHRALGEALANFHFDTVILTGQHMQQALPALPKAYYFPDKFSLHNWVMDNPQNNTFFLIKGSRGMALESILALLPEGKTED